VSKLEEAVEKIDAKCDRIDTTLAVMTAKFEEHLKTDEKMYEEFKHMVQILRENVDDMKEHISRTNILQEMVVGMNKRLEPIEQERLKREAVSEFMKSKAAKVVKIASVLAAIITIAYYVLKIKSGG